MGDTFDTGSWVGYKCADNYELTFTHNDVAVGTNDWKSCMRQCYVPPTETCVGKDDNDKLGYGDKVPIAVWDVLNCYCKPKKCPAHTLPAGLSYVDPSAAKEDYYPTAGQDTVQLKCNDDKLTSNGGSNAMVEHICEDYKWKDVTHNCVNLGCVDPRANAKTAFAWSLNTDHTCSSLDSTKLKGASDFVLRSDTDLTYASTTPLGFPWNHYDSFAPRLLDVGNAGDGTWARFQCRKGFKAYYNAHCAVASGNWAASNADHFDCLCENGRWLCQHECRCEGYCIKDNLDIPEKSL